jgi:hypothetical protein
MVRLQPKHSKKDLLKKCEMLPWGMTNKELYDG